MKAAVYRGIGRISMEEVEMPRVGEREYLVKVLYAGLCGTDIKTFKQGHHMFTPPCVLGQEKGIRCALHRLRPLRSVPQRP